MQSRFEVDEQEPCASELLVDWLNALVKAGGEMLQEARRRAGGALLGLPVSVLADICGVDRALMAGLASSRCDLRGCGYSVETGGNGAPETWASWSEVLALLVTLPEGYLLRQGRNGRSVERSLCVEAAGGRIEAKVLEQTPAECTVTPGREELLIGLRGKAVRALVAFREADLSLDAIDVLMTHCAADYKGGL